jgi:peptide/nickel transport system substrate-binding protein
VSEDSKSSWDWISRRQFLGRGVQGAAAVAAADLLASCGGSTSASSSSTSTTAGTPKRGGTLTVGQITGGPVETLYPPLSITAVDGTRAFQLYESLWSVGRNLAPVPALAESAEPNKTATLWTIHVRPGVHFHSGKPLTADDVLYSIQTWTNPKFNSNAAITTQIIDLTKTRTVGPLTVEIATKIPLADFPGVFASYYYSVFPAGSTVAELKQKPDGTGPFKYVSFTPGRQSVMSANREYWMEGLPYLDTLIINSSFTDETARYNAFLSGDLNINLAMPYTLAKQGGPFKLLNSRGAAFDAFPMRIDVAPFSDVRVRQAMRLIASRPEFISNVFDGFGTVGNDMPCAGTPYYASSLPQRVADIEQAKSLLKSAGHPNLAVTLNVGAVQDGFTQAAALFKEQATAAGVTVNVNTLSPSVYYNTSGGGQWLSYPFSVTGWIEYTSSLASFYLATLSKGAPFNETHWGDAQTDALLFDAMGTVDQAAAADKWLAVQKLQYDQGGYLVWGTTNYVDALKPNVMGLQPSEASWCDNAGFLYAWLA